MLDNDIIDIQDRFLVDDDHSRIRGFVACYDEAGNRLFLKENMIVISGRKAILDRLRTTGHISSFFDEMKAFLDKSTSVTSPGMTCSFFTDATIKGLTPIKIQTANNDEGYIKVLDAGTKYYTIEEDADSLEQKLVAVSNGAELKNGVAYYTAETATAPFSVSITYFDGNNIRTTSPATATGPIKAVTPANLIINPDKTYYVKDGSAYVAAEHPTQGTDYYLKRIKDVDFDLVECFKITYSAGNANGQMRYGSLGLYFPNPDTLFSRVTFPPYSARSNLTFFYYLYF